MNRLPDTKSRGTISRSQMDNAGLELELKLNPILSYRDLSYLFKTDKSNIQREARIALGKVALAMRRAA